MGWAGGCLGGFGYASVLDPFWRGGLFGGSCWTVIFSITWEFSLLLIWMNCDSVIFSWALGFGIMLGNVCL